jgi:uncharacterized membrane protein (TIGR02234 family)
VIDESEPPSVPGEPPRDASAPTDRGAAAATAGSPGRELGLVLAACAGGAAMALLASGRVWLRLTAPRTPPLPGLSAALTGRDVEPLVPALAVVGLAGVVALLATRRWGRVLVGALLAAAGLALVIRSMPHLAAPSAGHARALLMDQGRATGEPPGTTVTATASRGWPVVAALGGLALLAGGLGTVLRCRRWPGMPARYDRPAATPGSVEPRAGTDGPEPGEPAAGAAWEALDRGEDPTLADPDRGGE